MPTRSKNAASLTNSGHKLADPPQRIMRLLHVAPFLVALLASAACVQELETAMQDQAVGGGGGGDDETCPWWGCGSNSPVIDTWLFHELEPNGAANSAGVRLINMTKGGMTYRASVINARMIGVPTDPSYPSLRGASLVGATLLVQTPDRYVDIDITAVSMVTPYWVGTPELNETYRFEYRGHLASEDPRPLCVNPPSETDPEVMAGGWPAPLEALVFAGDRYDAATKTVIATGGRAGAWFNIGCAGSALAKLHLNRHTEAGSDATHVTDAGRRQALLKMYASDVCGTGKPFTIAGEPLHWQSSNGWVTLTGNESSFEALWDRNGALCLDEHRLEGDPAFPNIYQDILSECHSAGKWLDDAPPCDSFEGFPESWPLGAYLLSANP